MMVKVKTFGLCYLLLLISAMAAARSSKTVGEGCGYRLVGIKAERLPDLNIPRSHHAILNVGGEVVVTGGHTYNFIPTPTAEYFKDGQWHVVDMAYTHDGGLAIQLTSGKVLVAGGFEKEMGIGQTWGVELYDPATHTFSGIASLDTKRALASAVEIDSGKVVIAGNWYAGDAIEMFDGDHTFSHVKAVSQEREAPLMLRIAKDNVIIFGCHDNRGKRIDGSKVDYLRGAPKSIPLLEGCRTLAFDFSVDQSTSFIGNEQEDDYTYLIALVFDGAPQKDSIAIVRVHNGEFSPLPTDCPVPMMSKWGPITYVPRILADRHRHKAYMLGYDSWKDETPSSPARCYVLTIDYAQEPATLSLGYTEPLKDVDLQHNQQVLTADGNLMLAGGLPDRSNFRPSSTVWLLHVNSEAFASTPLGGRGGWLGGLLLLLLVVIASLVYIYYIRVRRKSVAGRQSQAAASETTGSEEQLADPQASLMKDICRLLEEEQLYLDRSLKIQDVAERLNTNRTYISQCINSVKGCSFTQLVNAYRVEHAQRLLRQQPDMKIVTVAYSSGFGSEMSFFRAFKSVTGTSPKEWKNNTYPPPPNI